MAVNTAGVKYQPALGVKPPSIPSKPVTPSITPQQTGYNRVQYDPNAILDTLQAMIQNARYRLSSNRPQMPNAPAAVRNYRQLAQQAYGQPQGEVQGGMGNGQGREEPQPVQFQSPWVQDPYALGVSSFMQPDMMQVGTNTWDGIDMTPVMQPSKGKRVRWNGEQEDWMNKPLVRQQTILERLLDQQQNKKVNPEEGNPKNPYYGGGYGWGGGGGGGSYSPGYDFFFNLLNWRI